MTTEQRVLVLGGISSGKSSLAERMLADASGERRYLATGRENPDDPDWQRRIAAHRERRGDAWQTVDCSTGPDALIEALADAPAGAAVLVDDLGGWAGLLLEAAGIVDDAPAKPKRPTKRTSAATRKRSSATARATTDADPATGTGGDADPASGTDKAVPATGDDDAVPATGTGSASGTEPATGTGTAGAGPGSDAAAPATGSDAPAEPVATGTGAVETGAAGTTVLADAPARLAAAVAASPAATLVLVSPEVGLTVVPASRTGRHFADLLGAINRAVADVSDRVALVVAGRTLWLPADGDAAAAVPATSAAPAAATAKARTEPVGSASTPAAAPDSADMPEPVDAGPAELDDDIIGIRPPDRIAINAAEERLTALATGGAGLGALTEPVAWALGAGDLAGEWDSIRVVVVGADHDGGARAGDPPAQRTIDRVRAGTAPLARLADRVGAAVTVADLPAEAEAVPAMETTDVLTAEQVDAAFELGRSLAERAADEGVQLLVPAACGAGVQTVSAAVLAAATGNEPASLLGRVVGESGRVDDAAWIERCVAARDALHRVRLRSRDSRSLLAMLGGPDLAALTGLIIGAAVRHVPVVVDNPAAATAMVLARDIAPSSPWWCLIPDHGRSPAVRTVADLLGFDTVLDLGLGLGDGCTALTAVGVLQPALALAATLREPGAAEAVHA
ncbi:bifunctional adenosylcobinamide kinase/adenosylcobinamide-phosphate guanylyltransferase [Actinocatenispora sera]|uniref:Adenosylcobinamide kinase n=1 Tax=Actinocatenispora sera TaxID=390989 RepID=A0A810L1W6_9ACTN|nr:bifunctional adenosylcobinamide kinase/adenosylcobinamide-phosphate guanylyltransferase [Actinocatenispora sera]BCJ29530.1 hypothetical protein Asera_36380 [Actinocatenispora sera]